jgi:hypothetical protein
LATNSRNQPAILHKSDEILRLNDQLKSVVAATRHQGRDYAFQHENNKTGAQGTVRENARNKPV